MKKEDVEDILQFELTGLSGRIIAIKGHLDLLGREVAFVKSLAMELISIRSDPGRGEERIK
jgi:hypothetical protein